MLDMAIPNNKVPRVFINTGIEYNMIQDFVKTFVQNDERFVVIFPRKNIKHMLNDVGYPFKSKEHSQLVGLYQNNGHSKTTMRYYNPYSEIVNESERNSVCLSDGIIEYINSQNINYEYLKNMIYEFSIDNGISEEICLILQNKVDECSKRRRFQCPKILRYQFEYENIGFHISKNCCDELKKKPFKIWQNENSKPYKLTGERKSEGGLRSIHGDCLSVDKNGVLKKFKPLNPCNDDFIQWFINKFNIETCCLYKEPYNFKRTGCKGCPYNVKLQDDLDTMERLMPQERLQCEFIWRPVYEEYRRIGYRLKYDKNDEKEA